ncbi:hypothetical protein Y032_0079g1228 [Ancylostoma ceylanicum]|uniref:Uncharacterized protein n=1 Tax=Ancylostoma ceylanicum TaxID=53326 RepID=A0A016TSX5_9BILA|nr:hypothetical protein Y032_0079g1228 [Ancylostoma ceylanicum]
MLWTWALTIEHDISRRHSLDSDATSILLHSHSSTNKSTTGGFRLRWDQPQCMIIEFVISLSFTILLNFGVVIGVVMTSCKRQRNLASNTPSLNGNCPLNGKLGQLSLHKVNFH